MSGENRPGKWKNRNPETTQKVTDAELLHQLKKVDAQIEEGQRESEDCEDALYCKSLVPIMKALPLKKKRLAKIKISQLLFDLEFNEWQYLTAFVPFKVGKTVEQDLDHSYSIHYKTCNFKYQSKVDLGLL